MRTEREVTEGKESRLGCWFVFEAQMERSCLLFEADENYCISVGTRFLSAFTWWL